MLNGRPTLEERKKARQWLERIFDYLEKRSSPISSGRRVVFVAEKKTNKKYKTVVLCWTPTDYGNGGFQRSLWNKC